MVNPSQRGDHVIDIVGGQGSMTHGTQTIALKPGMVVHDRPERHVWAGIVHEKAVQSAVRPDVVGSVSAW